MFVFLPENRLCNTTLGGSISHRSPAQGELDGVQVGHGTPHLSDQTLLGHVDVAQVEGVVDGLHLPHLDEPHPHRLGGGLQDPLPVVLRLVQHLVRGRGGGGGGLLRFQLEVTITASGCRTLAGRPVH